MDTVYPAAASALARGRRLRRAAPRVRRRTTPVTFAEIKEVDEENEEGREAAGGGGGGGEAERRRPDVLDEALGAPLAALDEPLGRQLVEFRRRRARVHVLREPPEEPPPRAGSEPRGAAD